MIPKYWTAIAFTFGVFAGGVLYAVTLAEHRAATVAAPDCTKRIAEVARKCAAAGGWVDYAYQDVNDFDGEKQLVCVRPPMAPGTREALRP